MNMQRPDKQGFTIVELLVVIAVIGILTAIGIVSYSGVQRHSVEAVVQTGLKEGHDQMEILQLRTGAYPTALPEDIKPSPDVTFQLVTSSLPHYSGLGTVQNGVLFQKVCADLIGEGYGTGTNNGNQSEQYVTACNVYGRAAMQINGWNAHDFNVPIDSATVRDWYEANISYDSYRPHHKTDVVTFASALSSRFTAMGGSFPVTSFWDPWASPGNGVAKVDLPEPDASGGGETYCLQATSTRFSDVVWHVSPSGRVMNGACS